MINSSKSNLLLLLFCVILKICGILISNSVCNPLGEKIEAVYGYIPSTKTAIIEMSAAAGITLITQKERNPMNTTTYGVGVVVEQ